jgi:flagellar basal-body rod modification protein FlgD
MAAVGSINSSTLADLNGASTTAAANDPGSAERFLKLLVAQMQNQDPLSPMDNAQVTSQIAQINTVSGIEKLNGTVQGLSGQFSQMQALQGAALVGREVVVPGNALTVKDGVGRGTFELNAAADKVQVEVLNAAGTVIETFQLGARPAGIGDFDWKPASTAGATSFRVTATADGAALTPTPLVRDTVRAISTLGNQLTLELKNSGQVAYGAVRSFT